MKSIQTDPRDPETAAETPEHGDSVHSRRRALRLAGAGLVGAVTASALSDAVAADDGVTLTAGTPTTTVAPVRTVYQGAAGNVGYLFESGVSGGSNGTTFPAVVGAWARPSGQPIHGIYAFTAKPSGSAVVAESTAIGSVAMQSTGDSFGLSARGLTDTGVFGEGPLRGVWGESESIGVQGHSTGLASSMRIGVRGAAAGEYATGVYGDVAEANSNGVSGLSRGSGGIGVLGDGETGGDFSGRRGSGGVGVRADGATIGIQAKGDNANAWFVPGGVAAPARTAAHQVGELVVDAAGDSWICVAGGTPGTWRKLAGPSSAGAFHAIEPARVYDSRLTMTPTANGLLVSGQNRVVPVKDRRDVVTGVVNALDVVPVGATAISYNVTVVAMQGFGNVYVAPASATTVNASTINWAPTTPGAVANGSTVAIDPARSIKLFVSGQSTARTHVIIDVNGYYR